MLRQTISHLQVSTRGRRLYDVTADVQRRVADARIVTGLCTLHLMHTSASLLMTIGGMNAISQPLRSPVWPTEHPLCDGTGPTPQEGVEATI